MKKRILFVSLIVISGIFCFYKLEDLFSPGSYSRAEKYELNYPEVEVVEAINRLKESNSDFVVPKVAIQNNQQFDLNDGKESETDYWHNFYFYDKVKDQILFTWTRPSGPYSTTFAFVSINDGLNLGHWKNINGDAGFFENRKHKKRFEETILKKIKDNLERK